MSDQLEQRRGLSSSFINQNQQQSNVIVRILKKVDIFSFIPVPKDQSVSTKQSLVGTALFFIIFLAFVIIDFVKFLTVNPPVIQSYRTPLDNNEYTLPNFAIAFMNGALTNQTEPWNNLFTYDYKTFIKAQNKQVDIPLTWDYVTYNKTTNTSNNFNLIPWMSEQTKQFYSILRTPKQPLKAQGLLYVSNENKYVRIKVFFCTNYTSTQNCLEQDNMTDLANHGRFFLFIQNKVDQSSISLQKPAANGNNYLLYNFFVIPKFYKRININFQIIRDQILPDYFFRFTTQKVERLQIESVFEQVSVVDYNNPKMDALAFNFQLAPITINNRVTFRTLMDMISLWGAFWGVLFAVFAIIFLSYNRKKFYKKNPDWDKFKNKINPTQIVQNEQWRQQK